ncbi:MAG: hypothetical protein RL748_3728, partial [Pseudomonadota bacterium]
VVNLAAGRRLLDPSGKVYLTESALNLAAGASGSLSARQMVKRDMVQVVNASQPFYAIQITPPSDPENAISGLAVSVNGIDYPYAQVATVHDLDAVKASMQAAVLVLYGRDAQAVRAGMFSLIHKTFASHLRQEVSALQVEVSDFQVMVTPPACLLPEPALFDCRPSQHKTKQKPQANQMQETEIRNHCGP